MEKHFFAVDPGMEVPLQGIGISFAEHTLYLTISPRGAIHVIPINCETDNEYNRTKEIGLLDGVKRWVRLYTDRRTKSTRCFLRRRAASMNRIWPPAERSQDFPALLPRQGPDDRHHRA